MFGGKSWARSLALGLLAASSADAVYMTPHAKDMFDYEMTFLDKIYDRDIGYLWYFYYPLAAGPHETRSTVWYATGLLQRNEGDDVEQAVRIIKSVIGDQEKNVSAQWYGDYTKYPEQPTVGTDVYPASIYNSWDPNWRGFIATTLIIIYEEFGSLLTPDVKELILESLYNNTVGDSYRVGGVDGDNLYPSYTNPWLMRCVVTGWTGRMMNDSNMTAAAETDANTALELFNLNNTLPEFNVPTYYGISLMALTMWAKYMPADSAMGQNGARMVNQVWEAAASFYNANMRNLAGPWDRNYGYDMNQYVAILSLYVWSLVGRDHVFPTEDMYLLAHADDGQFAPVVSVLSAYHATLVSTDTLSKLTVFPGEHMVHRSAFAPPADIVPRNISTWLSANLTIGAMSYNQTVIGGAREDATSFMPGVVQWLRNDASVGCFNLIPTEMGMQASVAPGEVTLTYPQGNASSVFTFVVSPNPMGGKRDILALADVQDLGIEVSGSVNPTPVAAFCGLMGGSCDVIHNFEHWNLTFVMPANSTEVPCINLKFTLE